MNSELEALLQRCTVKITIPGHIGWGTGFFVAPGFILTCAHVVKGLDSDANALIHYQPEEALAEAKIIQIAPQRDLALLEFHVPPNTELPCVYLDKAVQPGNQLYFFGYPDQDFPQGCPVTGSCEGLTGDVPPLIKFKLGQVRPGMSGSALLNQETGKVCGIVKFTRDRTIDLGGGAIPTSTILTQFPELIIQQQAFHKRDKRWSKQLEPAQESIPTNLIRNGAVKFVGRSESMLTLHELLTQGKQNSISAITGMGGIGKTELALQYALRYKTNYPGGICWLQARSDDIGKQIVRFAESSLGLTPPGHLELLGKVKYCWQNWNPGSVLLIFDDVIDYEEISSEYLPPLTEGRFNVLMTTRLRLGRSVNQLELDVLDEAGAISLLKALTSNQRIDGQISDAQQLCKWLGYLPLGVELVGRYLFRKADLSISQLLKRLETQQLQAQSLLRTDGDMTAKRGVEAAFQLSWKDLSKNAQNLGCMLSLFAATPMPWALVELCLPDQNLEDLEDLRDRELLDSHLLQYLTTGIYYLHPLIREFFIEKRMEWKSGRNIFPELEKHFFNNLISLGQQIGELKMNKHMYIPHLVEASKILKDKNSFDFFDSKEIMKAIKEVLSKLPQSSSQCGREVRSSMRTYADFECSQVDDDYRCSSVLPNEKIISDKKENINKTKAMTRDSLQSVEKSSDLFIQGESLDIGRALRPLMRKVSTDKVLDEESTIRQIAEKNLWSPVMKASPGPLWSLVLVIDKSPFLLHRLPLLQELQKLFSRYGCFRDVKKWTILQTQKKEIKVFSEAISNNEGSHLVGPNALIDPAGRRLILIISDVTSDIWYSENMKSTLKHWTSNSSVSLLQLIPKSLWLKTALASAFPVSLRASVPGAANSNFHIEKEPHQNQSDSNLENFVFPVISFDPQDISDWAKVVSGSYNSSCPGFMFHGPLKSRISEINSPERQVEIFIKKTSPSVSQLAQLLASSPIVTIPIANLVRTVLLPKSSLMDLFEVLFLSKLLIVENLDGITDPHKMEFHFANPDVRKILQTL